MGKTGQRVMVGCLVFLCLIVGWEIIATIRYKNYVEEEIKSREFINSIDFGAGTTFQREDEIRREIEQEGNPYSLFR